MPTGVSAFRETDGGTEAARWFGRAIVIAEAGLEKRRLNGKYGRVEGNAAMLVTLAASRFQPREPARLARPLSLPDFASVARSPRIAHL